MTSAERLDTWLVGNQITEFTSHDLADGLDLEPSEASVMIRAYLDAQRRKNSRTVYVLKRQGRTSNAYWSVGQRKADAHVIAGTLFDDVGVKINRAFAPDLARLATINPRAARYVEARIEAVLSGALTVLAAACDVYMEGDEA